MSYSVFAQYYDLFTADVDYPRRARWIAGLLAARGIGSGLTLDLACGTGSLTWELASLGYEMIGTDQSAEMLMEAHAKAARYPGVQPPLFLCQSMTELDLYGTVRAAVCTLDSMNHLADMKQVRRAIGLTALFMEPGGIFVFDVNTRYKHQQVLGCNSFVYETPRVLCAWRNSLSSSGARVDIALDFFERQPGGTYLRQSEDFSEWYYSPRQLRGALDQAGFDLLDVYGEFTDQPPAPDCQRAVFVARRRGQV